MTQILEPAEKDIKTVITTASHMFKKLIPYVHGRRKTKMSQIEHPEMKTVMRERRNTLKGSKAEGNTGKLEDRATETSQNKQREKYV